MTPSGDRTLPAITEYDADAFIRLLYGWGEDIIRVDARIGPRRTTVFYRHVEETKGWSIKMILDTAPIEHWHETGDTSYIDERWRVAGPMPQGGA